MTVYGEQCWYSRSPKEKISLWDPTEVVQSLRALCNNVYSSEKDGENLQQRALEAGRGVPTLTGLSRALYISQLAAENR